MEVKWIMLHSILLCVCVCLCGGDAASQQINLFRWKDVARFVNIQPWRMLIKQLLCCAVRGRQEMVDRKKFHCCWETDMFYTIRMARVITVDSRGRKYLCRRWKWRQAQSLSIQTNREHISIFYFSVAIDNFRGFFILIYCINIILFFYIGVNRNVRIYYIWVWCVISRQSQHLNKWSGSMWCRAVEFIFFFPLEHLAAVSIFDELLTIHQYWESIYWWWRVVVRQNVFVCNATDDTPMELSHVIDSILENNNWRNVMGGLCLMRQISNFIFAEAYATINDWQWIDTHLT